MYTWNRKIKIILSDFHHFWCQMSCQSILTHLLTDVNMYRLSRNPLVFQCKNKVLKQNHLRGAAPNTCSVLFTACEHHRIFYCNWHLDWQTDQDNNIKDEACHFCIKPNCKTSRRLTESSACQTESPAPKLTWLAESESDKQTDHNVSLFRKPNDQQLASNLCSIIRSAFAANAVGQKSSSES